MEQNPPWEANSFSDSSKKKFLHFMETEGSLQHLQQSVSSPSPDDKAYVAAE
jgi:hypothetical protein